MNYLCTVEVHYYCAPGVEMFGLDLQPSTLLSGLSDLSPVTTTKQLPLHTAAMWVVHCWNSIQN
jgi:hypothetical protein